MFIKCFTKNKNNKIEFTEQELKELLDEVYKYGYNEGNKKTYWYTSPLYTSPTVVNSDPWLEYTTTSASTSDDTITIKSDGILKNVIV